MLSDRENCDIRNGSGDVAEFEVAAEYAEIRSKTHFAPTAARTVSLATGMALFHRVR